MNHLCWPTIAVLCWPACQSYEPEPVDLLSHARLFADRIPEASLIQSFALSLRARDPGSPVFDVADGVDLDEARYVALLFNPQLRTVRSQADVQKASAELAGLWADPQFSGSFFYVLENVWQYNWFAGGYVAQTLPITGLPGLEKGLAETAHGEALLQARRAEADILNRLESVWLRYSARVLRSRSLNDLVGRLQALEETAARLASAHALSQMESRTFTLARLRYQAELLSANGEALALLLSLRELLGMPPDREIRLVPRFAAMARVAPDDRHNRLLTSPMVELAKRQHDVAEHELELAIRKQYPELWIQPGWQEEDGQPRPAFGFSLPLPLWNGNAREIAEMRAARAAAAELLKEQLETATHALARAEARSAVAAAQRQLLETQLLPLAELQVTEAKRLAELGQLDTLLILDAVTRAYDAQLAVIDATLAEAEATVDLNALFWPSLVAEVEVKEDRP